MYNAQLTTIILILFYWPKNAAVILIRLNINFLLFGLY